MSILDVTDSLTTGTPIEAVAEIERTIIADHAVTHRIILVPRNAIIVHRNDALLRRRHSVRSAKITSVSRQAKHRLSFNLAERPHPLAGKHVEGADMYTNRAIVVPVAPPAERAENLTISRSNAAPREIGDIDGTAHVGRLALIQPTPCLSLEYQKMKLACLLT